jgi:hypothetical protein
LLLWCVFFFNEITPINNDSTADLLQTDQRTLNLGAFMTGNRLQKDLRTP